MTMKEFYFLKESPFPEEPLMREMAEKREAVFSEIQEKANRIIQELKMLTMIFPYYRATEVVQRIREFWRILPRLRDALCGRWRDPAGRAQAHVEVSKMIDDLIMLDQRMRPLKQKLIALLNRPPVSPLGKPGEVSFRKIPFTVGELQTGRSR